MRGCILPRQSFKVTYIRRGDSDTWSVSLDRGQVFRQTESSGVIGYGSYLWRGLAPADEHFAVVTVLLACDACLFEPGILVDPIIWESMGLYARMLADASLRERHPRALIEAGSALAAVATRPAIAHGSGPGAIGRRFLTVEDNAPMRKARSGLLKSRGRIVRKAEAVSQGLALLESPLDLAVVDLMLPDGDKEDFSTPTRSTPSASDRRSAMGGEARPVDAAYKVG